MNEEQSGLGGAEAATMGLVLSLWAVKSILDLQGGPEWPSFQVFS